MATSRLDVLDRYMEGFRRSDHELVLGCLTEDVVWRVHGVRTTNGKAEFDGEIENPDFEGSPKLTVDRTVEAGDVIVTMGTGVGHRRRLAASSSSTATLFTFRGDLIAEVESDVVQLAEVFPGRMATGIQETLSLTARSDASGSRVHRNSALNRHGSLTKALES